MKDFSIIAEDGITLADIRELVKKTEKYDGNTPVILLVSDDDPPEAREIIVIEDKPSIGFFNYC